jgi:hypothetical protein
MDKIKELIAAGKIKEAFQELEIVFSKTEQLSKLDKVLLLKSQYNHWKEDDIRGLEPSIAQINKIKSSLLEICNSSSDIIQGNKAHSKPTKDNNKYLALLGLTLFIIAAVLIYLNFNKTNEDPTFSYTVADEKIGIVISENIGLNLHPIFEKSYLRGVEETNFDLIKNSELIISELQEFDNAELNISSLIYKYFGLAICYKVIALTTKSDQHQVECANKCIENSKKALSLVTAIEQGDAPISNKEIKQQISQWLLSDNIKENLQTLILIGNCIKKSKRDPTVDESEIQLLIASLARNNFLKKEGYAEYPIVKSTINLLN